MYMRLVKYLLEWRLISLPKTVNVLTFRGYRLISVMSYVLQTSYKQYINVYINNVKSLSLKVNYTFGMVWTTENYFICTNYSKIYKINKLVSIFFIGYANELNLVQIM